MMTEAQMDTVIGEALPRRSAWRRNAKGNLTRRLGAKLLTVYRQGVGWAWSIRRGDAVGFSAGVYRTEKQAIAAVLAAVDG